MANDELIRAAHGALGDLDPRAFFWIDVGVATCGGASTDHVEWEELDWEELRASLERWLDQLDPASCPTSFQVPVEEDIMLVFRVRARTPMARGWKAKPSLTLAETVLPTVWFEDGAEASFYSLSRKDVEALATGRRKLAIELQSHRETWEMLLGEMNHFGHNNTSAMRPTVLETYASMLGLTEAPPELGDFDTAWRAINHTPPEEDEDDPRGP